VHGREQLGRILSAGLGGSLTAGMMDVAEVREPMIARPPVGNDRRTRLDVVGHEPVQRGGRGVSNRGHSAPAYALRLADLHRDRRQDFLAGSSAPVARLLTTDPSLIHLHRAAQPVTTGAHQHGSQSMQHRPGRLVRADLQGPLQAQCRYAVLRRGEHPAGRKPNRKRCPSAIENRPRRPRHAAAACPAHEPAVAQPPTVSRGGRGPTAHVCSVDWELQSTQRRRSPVPICHFPRRGAARLTGPCGAVGVSGRVPGVDSRHFPRRLPMTRIPWMASRWALRTQRRGGRLCRHPTRLFWPRAVPLDLARDLQGRYRIERQLGEGGVALTGAVPNRR